MSRKTTKRALIASLISVILCVSMLIGSTFAWFTDTASTGVNTITAGNLDVGLYYAEGTEDPAAVEWKNAEGASVFDYNLWEPGYTVAKHIKIANNGSLALKYELAFAIDRAEVSADVKDLAEVIDVFLVSDATKVADRTALVGIEPVGTLASVIAGDYGVGDLNGELDAEDFETFTLVLKMRESAGNEYKNATVGKLSIHLMATQNTVESDSFDNQYDKDANNLFYPGEIVSEDNARAILDKGGVVDFGGAVMYNGLAGDNNYGANLREYTFKAGTTVKNLTLKGASGATRWLHSEGDVTFENCVFEAEGVYAVHFDSGEGTLTFRNCKISGWSSFGRTFTKVIFENCEFDEAVKDNSWGLLRFYCDAVINNCTFAEGFDRIDNAIAGITIKIDGCTGHAGKMFCNGDPATLGATWIVDGIDISDTIK